MKKIVWCLILCTLFLFAGYTYAVTSSDAFDWALDAGLLTSYKTEYLKNEYLTREMVAPILVNFIDNIARKGYSGNLCKANDIEVAEDAFEDDLRTLCNFWILRWSNGRINPKRTLSTQEAVALVMRIIDWYQKEKTQGHRAYYYYERARTLWYLGVPNILDDSKSMITIEDFVTFIYSTQHPWETITKTKTTVKYTTWWEFKSSDDALLKLLEIFDR